MAGNTPVSLLKHVSLSRHLGSSSLASGGFSSSKKKSCTFWNHSADWYGGSALWSAGFVMALLTEDELINRGLVLTMVNDILHR